MLVDEDFLPLSQTAQVQTYKNNKRKKIEGNFLQDTATAEENKKEKIKRKKCSTLFDSTMLKARLDQK